MQPAEPQTSGINLFSRPSITPVERSDSFSDKKGMGLEPVTFRDIITSEHAPSPLRKQYSIDIIPPTPPPLALIDPSKLSPLAQAHFAAATPETPDDQPAVTTFATAAGHTTASPVTSMISETHRHSAHADSQPSIIDPSDVSVRIEASNNQQSSHVSTPLQEQHPSLNAVNIAEELHHQSIMHPSHDHATNLHVNFSSEPPVVIDEPITAADDDAPPIVSEPPSVAAQPSTAQHANHVTDYIATTSSDAALHSPAIATTAAYVHLGPPPAPPADEAATDEDDDDDAFDGAAAAPSATSPVKVLHKQDSYLLAMESRTSVSHQTSVYDEDMMV